MSRGRGMIGASSVKLLYYLLDIRFLRQNYHLHVIKNILKVGLKNILQVAMLERLIVGHQLYEE